MFQFPWFPLPALCVQAGVTSHYECGVSPFGHLRITGWSAPTRSFSQPPTSFIGSCRQGIHRWPLVAWDFTHTKMLVLAMKFSSSASTRNSPRKGRTAGRERRAGHTPSQRKTGRAPGHGATRGRTDGPDAGKCVNWVSSPGTN